jgi:hypothetical protein
MIIYGNEKSFPIPVISTYFGSHIFSQSNS